MIKFIRIGYWHPSNANWSYGIWLVTDETGSKLYKETFGGDYRALETLKSRDLDAKTEYVEFLGQFKGREVGKMPDIESYQGINYPVS